MAPTSRSKRKRREYTATQKQAALDLYETDGPAATSKQLGIPKSTIDSWAKKANIRTGRNKKTEAATKAAEIDASAVRAEVAKLAITGSRKTLNILLRRLDNEEDIAIKDLIPLFGVLVDKNIALTRANEGSEQHNAVDAWLNHITGGETL